MGQKKTIQNSPFRIVQSTQLQVVFLQTWNQYRTGESTQLCFPALITPVLWSRSLVAGKEITKCYSGSEYMKKIPVYEDVLEIVTYNFNPIRVKHVGTRVSIHVKKDQYSSQKKLIFMVSNKTIRSRGSSSDWRLRWAGAERKIRYGAVSGWCTGM